MVCAVLVASAANARFTKAPVEANRQSDKSIANINLSDVQEYYTEQVDEKAVLSRAQPVAIERKSEREDTHSKPMRTAVFQELIDKLSPIERAIVLSLEKKAMTLNEITDAVTKKHDVKATYFSVGKACSMLIWGGKGNKEHYEKKGMKFKLLNKEKRGNVAIYSLFQG